MYQKFKSDSVKKFIAENLTSDLVKLMLRKSPFPDISMAELAVQIKGKLKAKEKLPVLFQTDGIYYPPTISMEQCSSEQTAAYKASLCQGNRLIDLSGGFGVDSWMFSKNFPEVIYCEQNLELTGIACHNFAILGAKNITVFNTDGIDFLLQQHQKFDWIYIDPSRRNDHQQKRHAFADCSPDVATHLPLFFEHADKIMIKASPMLDIEQAVSELKNVVEIHIVAIKNEVREVLYLLEKDHFDDIKIFTVNLFDPIKKQTFSFTKQELQQAKASFSLPLQFLYEPNNAIMKSGAFNLVGERFNLFKLHKNSHLYTSDNLISEFPGKIFLIKNSFPYKSIPAISQANIITRNFPDTPDTVRKKLKIKEGGDIFLYCTTLMNEKPVILLCEKIQRSIF